jgi:peptidylprolyl isomerase/peptidyl-prolyl cis-trans isomerase C
MFGKVIFRIGLGVFLLAFVACSASKTAASKDTEKVNQAKVAPASAGESGKVESDASEVIVGVGDEKLTMQHIEWMEPNATSKRMAQLAKWWIENELLYAEAEKRGVTKQPRVQFLAEIMRRNTFRYEMVKSIQDVVKVTDEEALAYYEKNKDVDKWMMQPGYLDFSHIRTRTRNEAQAVLKRIKAGENINELAKQLSIYHDAKRGGRAEKYMYRTVRRRFSINFFKALVAAKEGELVGPIEVQEGGSYEVAVKTGHVKPAPMPFEKAKEKVKGHLEQIEKDKVSEALLDSLKKEAADKIIKSPRLIEAEKAIDERARKSKSAPPEPKSEPAKPTSPQN